MKRVGVTVLLAAIVLVVLVGLGFTMVKKGTLGSGRLTKDSGDNISDYSAIFLTNGQVYFGKLYSSTPEVVDLRDIYYLQVNQQIQPNQSGATASPAPNQQPDIVLVKLGDELHGPNDRMRVNSSQVLFIESLKKDSKVVKAIDDYVKNKK